MRITDQGMKGIMLLNIMFSYFALNYGCHHLSIIILKPFLKIKSLSPKTHKLSCIMSVYIYTHTHRYNVYILLAEHHSF